MLDPKANIKQYIYTACGLDHSGAFGIWSKSEGLDDFMYNDEILKVLNTVMIGKEGYNAKNFEKKVSYETRLKDGAIPHGIFKNKYYDSDYELVEIVQRDEIKVVEESDKGELRLKTKGHDFRNNLDKAPYRIAYTTLSDGRLMVCRTAAVGLVYSELDGREGNLFYHAYIFPEGTKISDIDVSKINFVKGLENKYWEGKNPEPAPKNLPELKVGDLYRTSSSSQVRAQRQTYSAPQNFQKQPAPQTNVNSQQNIRPQTQQSSTLKNEELIELLKKSVCEKDIKQRNLYKREFNQHVKAGINVPGLINNLYEKQIQYVSSGKGASDEIDSMIMELETRENPFTTLFNQMNAYCNLKTQLEKADYDNEKVITDGIKNARNYIKQCMQDVDLDKLLEFAESTKQYITNSKKLSVLEKTGRIPNAVNLSEGEEALNYMAADKLYSVAKQMKNGKTFDGQTVIR